LKKKQARRPFFAYLGEKRRISQIDYNPPRPTRRASAAWTADRLAPGELAAGRARRHHVTVEALARLAVPDMI
jgi:hypothetical protein